jgi:hypothetical protein
MRGLLIAGDSQTVSWLVPFYVAFQRSTFLQSAKIFRHV